MQKRKTTEQQKTTKDSLQEIEALLEIGVPPHRPPKKVQPEKTEAPKKTVKKTVKKVIKKVGEQVRWNTQTFLLTFPQWEGDETLEDLLELLCEFWKEKNREVKEAIIAIEEHGADAKAKGHEIGEDPGRHIHTCFKLDKRMDIRNPNYFDDLFGKHGDIQSCRDYKACQIYCCKKGNEGNWITKNVDIEAVIESTRTKKGVKHETVANFIRKKERTLYEVDEKYPGYVIQHQSKIQGYINLQEQKRSSKLEPYYGIDQAKTMMLGRDNPELIQLVSWLNNNLPPTVRPHKQKQLWIHGPPNVGKT